MGSYVCHSPVCNQMKKNPQTGYLELKNKTFGLQEDTSWGFVKRIGAINPGKATMFTKPSHVFFNVHS